MSALTEYIEQLKKGINQKGDISQIEKMRYVYIELGKKMNFDLDYTFGNNKEKKKIYNRAPTEIELSKVIESRNAICKSLAHLLRIIHKELGLPEISVKKENIGDHVYAVFEENGEYYKLDLENDLEYIQTGAKTRTFAVNEDDKKQPLISEEKLRKIDTDVIGYIPHGYYFEDMIDMLKKAISPSNIPLEEKLKMVLENLNVYNDNSKIQYREMVRYHQRIIEEVFTEKEQNKIQYANFVFKQGENKKYRSCIILNNSNREEIIYLTKLDSNQYEIITIEELAKLVQNGTKPLNGVPGLKRKIKEIKSTDNNDSDQR